LNKLAWEELGGNLARRFDDGDRIAAVVVEAAPGSDVDAATAAARLAYGASLGGYRFDRYRTKIPKDKKPTLRSLVVRCADAAAARAEFRDLDAVAAGVRLARDLVSEPGNVIYPRTLANAAQSLESLGVKVEVLGRARLERIGMRTLLAVAQGSDHEPYVVVMRWNGASSAKERPLAFVGKGVTFDSGGLSIKPSSGMEEMKFDMAGSAAVIGAMRALAGRKARVNAVGVIGLVENMPSAKAQRPGDIVTSLSGQTVEVLNTDAEGRLVLADCLTYTKDRFKPVAMLNLATLTGAIIAALGYHHAGIFSNDDRLSKELTDAGEAEGERVWRMPLGKEYDSDIDSPIADMKNTGGKGAGSIAAAQFLKRFVGDVPWVHIDIAGTAWSYKDKATVPKGATGYGVRLLNRLGADPYESAD
ncbi:MAG: leucyl aminopeptidase, partial [Proteobacteria bacterium]|nr:leucyl aminopeptidase [Pseudomonadota bacterium]